MNRQDAVRRLVEGVLLSGCFAALLFSMAYLPMGLGLLFIIVLPVFPALQVYRHGFLTAVGFALVTVSALGLTYDASVMLMALFLYATGLGLGYGLKRQLSIPNMAVGSGSASAEAYLAGLSGAMLGIMLIVILSPMISGTTLIASFEGAINHNIQSIQQLPADFGIVTEEQLNETIRAFQDMRDLFRQNLVLLLSCCALLVSFPAFLITRSLLPRAGVFVPPLPPFRTWQLPRAAMVVTMISFILMFFFEDGSGGWIETLISSINQIMLLLCVFEGIAVADFYLYQWRLPRVLRYLARPFLFMVPLLQSIFLLVGMIDLGFDLRRIRKMPDAE